MLCEQERQQVKADIFFLKMDACFFILTILPGGGDKRNGHRLLNVRVSRTANQLIELFIKGFTDVIEYWQKKKRNA